LCQKSKYKKYADKTRRSYKEWLNPFLIYCYNHSFDVETAEAGEAYIKTLVEKRRDLTYVNNVRLLLQKLFNYILPELTSRDLSDDIRCDTELILTNERLNKIIFWAEDHIDSHFELSAYILLIHYTAARPNEVHSLTVGKVKELLAMNETKIIGKGAITRTILTPATDLHEKILSSICARFVHDDSKLFTYHLRHLGRKFQNLQKNVLLLTAPYPGPHSLRRAAGRVIYEQSDIFMAMYRLGHKVPSTTHKYLRCNRESVKNLITLCENNRFRSKT
jgi:hypothetical protein